MDPLVLFATAGALLVYPGGLVLYVPAILARIAHLRHMRAQHLPPGHPLIGAGTVIALLACSVGAAQLPLPGNLLTSSVIVARGSYTDVGIFLVAFCIALVVSVRNRWAPTQILAACATGLALLVLAINARSLTFAAAVSTGGSHAFSLHLLAGIVCLLAAPGLLSIFNSREHLTAPLTVALLVGELIVALSLLPAFPTAIALGAGCIVLAALGGTVWRFRRITVLVRIASVAAVLGACAMVVIGVRS